MYHLIVPTRWTNVTLNVNRPFKSDIYYQSTIQRTDFQKKIYQYRLMVRDYLTTEISLAAYQFCLRSVLIFEKLTKLFVSLPSFLIDLVVVSDDISQY